MADTITITSDRPSQAQAITVTISEQIVALMDWSAANVKNTDGSNKYLHAMNVLWQDAIAILLPIWRQRYVDGQIAAARATLAAEVQAVDSTATQQVADGLAALQVVDPQYPGPGGPA